MKGRMLGTISVVWSVFLIVMLGSCAAKNGRSGVPSPPTPQYERDFLQNRVAHQQAAIEMAQACMQRAQPDPLKQFCVVLSATENAESKQLQSWLNQWYGLSALPGAQERATHKSTAILWSPFVHRTAPNSSGRSFQRCDCTIMKA